MEKPNPLDLINDDSTRMVISIKTVKWILGLLFTGIITILGFAWSLYTSVDSKVETVKTEIITKMEELEKERVRPVESKNVVQDLDIVRLFERTSRENSNTVPQTLINSNSLPPAMQNNK